MPNTLLTELTPEKALQTITDKMRKDLKEAFTRAAEHNDLDTYKDMLKQFQEELIAKQQAAATPKKTKKGKAKASDDDVDMEDVDDATTEKSKTKKRKAEDDVSVSTIPACLPRIEMLTFHELDTTENRFCQEAKDQTQHFHPQGCQRHSQDQGGFCRQN